ncbi:acyl carrier protein [Lachnospiraceae bacterium 62-35]
MEDLIEILEDMNPDIDYHTHKALVDDGILTSFELVNLVTQIADVFGVNVPPDRIVPENFNSATSIYALIERLEEE